MKTFLITLVKCYQWGLSPWMGRQCRFQPTCSHYAIEAIQRYGAWHGCKLAVCRIGRCHPWHPGGFDPLP
ncbi:membrane protein insertion efficiency factor YidD [Methylophilus aquaticus]|uniref:Putative membrane protein insertion efficiency factor n=2 Tax=Methylophilus aquaticus TaxID=1971610 RepID=A0ABT9JNR3_9PROT|nr:membrane protein insertion efficiency factor YidD [Methylophilus aquaticus]MDP8566242.1 membrane protein insertion efficiency factor YidD [Methylophilus aquaticus]